MHRFERRGRLEKKRVNKISIKKVHGSLVPWAFWYQSRTPYPRVFLLLAACFSSVNIWKPNPRVLPSSPSVSSGQNTQRRDNDFWFRPRLRPSRDLLPGTWSILQRLLWILWLAQSDVRVISIPCEVVRYARTCVSRIICFGWNGNTNLCLFSAEGVLKAFSQWLHG